MYFVLCTTIAMSCDIPTKGKHSSLLCCSNMDFVMSQRATTHHPGVCSTTPNLLHDASKCNCISFDRKLFFCWLLGLRKFLEMTIREWPEHRTFQFGWSATRAATCSVALVSVASSLSNPSRSGSRLRQKQTSFHIPESIVPSRYVKPLLSQFL